VKNDIKNILSQGTIGVLVSTSEGFPVCLLYGLAGLPTYQLMLVLVQI
jgi:hypothetical protein